MKYSQSCALIVISYLLILDLMLFYFYFSMIYSGPIPSPLIAMCVGIDEVPHGADQGREISLYMQRLEVKKGENTNHFLLNLLIT